MIDIEGKTALVTGAGSGIGKAICKELAKNGVNVAAAGRNMEKLNVLEKELLGYGIDIIKISVDLSKKEDALKLITNTINKFKSLDILVNNAGVAKSIPLKETTVEDWDYHMAVNARAPFILSREAVPYLQKSQCPVIINISSVVGHKGYVNQGAYSASKHALMGFTKVLAQEVQDIDIRVHAVSPGGVNTDMVSDMRSDIDKAQLMTPQDIADIVVFLITHRGNAVIDEINIRRAISQPWK